MISRFMAICLTVLLLVPAARAQQVGAAAFDTLAPHAILMDYKSGHIFLAKDAETPVPPASMSKLMTQVLVFDALKSGELKPDQMFTVSSDAARRGGTAEGSSTMFAKPNSQVSVDDLLHGAIIQSANDACIALAEGMAGTEAAFAQRMMAKAKELGLSNSYFANATGLPDPGQRMSVHDLATLASYIITKHPEYYKLYSEREFTWNKITQQNRNPLLKDYPGADGLKTGYTSEAGYGLVGSAEREGRRLIVVVAGLDSMEKRKLEAQKLLDYGFKQYKTLSIFEPGDVVTRVRVWGGTQRYVHVVSPEAFRISIAPYEQDKAELVMTSRSPLKAPVKEGTDVGYVSVLISGKEVARAKLQTAEEVPETPSMWGKAFDTAMIFWLGN